MSVFSASVPARHHVRRTLVTLLAALALLTALAPAATTLAFGTTRVLDWTYSSDGDCTAGPWFDRGFQGPGIGDNAAGGIMHGGPAGTICRMYGATQWWVPANGVAPGIAIHQIDVKFGSDHGGHLIVHWVQGSYHGNVSFLGDPIADWSACTGTADDGSFQGPGSCLNSESTTSAAPTGAVGLAFQWTNNWSGPSLIRITSSFDTGGGGGGGGGGGASGAFSTGTMPVLPPTGTCAATTCGIFSSPGGVSSTEAGGWSLEDTASPATSAIFPANPGAKVSFTGTWYLEGHFADLQMCYAGPSGNQCDSAALAHNALGSHAGGAPVVSSGVDPFGVGGLVPTGYNGVYLTWSSGSHAGIVTLFFSINGMGEEGQTTLDVSAFITLTDIPDFIIFGDSLANATTSAPQFTCYVLTNNSAGYDLTVVTSDMARNLGGDSIAATYFTYVVNGGGALSPANNSSPLLLAHRLVHSLATPGDPFDIDTSLAVPFVESGAYTGSAAFTASTL